MQKVPGPVCSISRGKELMEKGWGDIMGCSLESNATTLKKKHWTQWIHAVTQDVITQAYSSHIGWVVVRSSANHFLVITRHVRNSIPV